MKLLHDYILRDARLAVFTDGELYYEIYDEREKDGNHKTIYLYIGGETRPLSQDIALEGEDVEGIPYICGDFVEYAIPDCDTPWEILVAEHETYFALGILEGKTMMGGSDGSMV